MSAAGGYCAAVGSAICNGSFGTVSKLKRVEDAQVGMPSFAEANPAMLSTLQCSDRSAHLAIAP